MKHLILFLAMVLFACGPSVPAHSDVSSTLSIVTADGAVHPFKIELALTREAQARGLMNRTSMAQDAGMLFFFGAEAEQGFWMKNTLIPLDMVFIRKDGTIHHIHENAIPHDLTSVRSQGPVSAVLELNGGTAKRLNLSKGDVVHHLLFGNTLK